VDAVRQGTQDVFRRLIRTNAAVPRRGATSRKSISLALAGAVCAASQALADVPVVKAGDLEVKAQAGGGIYVEYQRSPGFGAGVEDQATGVRGPGDNLGLDAFAYAGVSGSVDTRTGRFFAAANSIATYTGLDGDSIGVARSGAKRFALEEAYIGWSSGDLLAGLPRNAATVTVGPQTFHLNDGFVLWDGNDDGPRDGTASLQVREAFPMAAVAQLDGSFFHLDAFWLRADADQAGSTLYGVQGGAVCPDIAEFGATYFRIYRSNNAANATAREGMQVVNLYGSARGELGGVRAKLKGGYTSQTGSVRVDGEVVPRIDYDAEAFYGSIELAVPRAPGAPALRYRYASYSGDDPNTILTTEEYDPLFIDPLEYGSVGFFNGSNAKRHEARLTVSATDKLDLRADYVASSLAKPVFRGKPLSSTAFSDYVSLTAEWKASKHTQVFLSVSAERPKSAAREYFGSGRTIVSSQLVALFNY
jgi:hypothetical protein